jgi:hypothetical protein
MADIAVTTFTNKTYKNGASTVVPGFVEGSPGSPVNPPGSGGASEFVPYVGANQNVNLGELGISTGFLTLDTTPTGTPTTQGTFYWDEDDNTVDIILNGYIMKVGEDLFYPVKNQTGSSIPKGTNVRFAGTVGGSGRLLITPYLADGSLATSRYMGVTAETIGNGEDGKVLWFGRIRGINTNAYNEGDILYASTSSAGGFQTTLPVAPNNIVEVCAVVTKSINNGVIFVRPQFLSSASIGGSIASGQVAFGTGVNTVGGDSGLTWDNTNKRLLIADTASPPFPFDFRIDKTSANGGYVGIGIRNANSTGEGTFAIRNNTGYLGFEVFGSSWTTVSLRNWALWTLESTLAGLGFATLGSAPIVFRTNAGSGGINNTRLTIEASGGITIADSNNLNIGTTTGTKIGTTTSQKLGFWNATPIIQPTTGVAESAFVENAGGTVINDDSTFDGYTIRQVVKALRDAGLLA